jgi:dihydrofolate reductase
MLCSKAKEGKSSESFSTKVYVIGGENIYKEFLPIAHRMIITEVELDIEDGDTFFPEWDISEWKEQSRDQREENGIKFSFVEYTRS